MHSRATLTLALLSVGLFALAPARADEIWVTNQTANKVHLIDAKTFGELATIPTGANPNAVSFSADFTRAYVSNLADGTVTVIDAVARKAVATLRSGGGAHSVNLSPDGRRLFVANSGEGSVSVFDTSSLALTTKIQVGGVPTVVAFSADGNSGYVASQDGALFVIDLKEGKAARLLQKLGGGIDIAITYDGKKIYLATGFSDIVKVVDVRARRVLQSVPAAKDAHSLRLTVDGHFVWVVNRLSNTIMVLETGSNRVMRMIHEVGDRPDVLAFSFDGRTAFLSLHGAVPAGYPEFLSGSESGLSVIDVGTGRVLKKVRLEGDPHGVAVRQSPASSGGEGKP